ncbi:PKD domain-containing protein [Peijinzhouia sedimentorum]
MKKLSLFLPLLFLAIFFFQSCENGSDEEEDTTPRPTVNFNFSPENPSIGETVNFTGTATNSTSYQWSSNPSGLTANAISVSYAFEEAGTYQVTFRATGPGGTTELSKTIEITAPEPSADFSFTPESPKVGETVVFTSSVSNVDSYVWSSEPAEFNSTEENPSFAFSNTGTYTITLEASGAGGTATVSKEIEVLYNIVNKRSEVLLENFKGFRITDEEEPIMYQRGILQVFANREDTNQRIYFFPPNALMKGVSPTVTTDTSYVFEGFEYANPFELSYGEIKPFVESFTSSGGVDLFPIPEPTVLPTTSELVNGTILNFDITFPAARITITSLASGDSISYLRNVESDGRMILVRSENLDSSKGFKFKIAISYRYGNSDPDQNGWTRVNRSVSTFEFYTKIPSGL